LRRFNLKGGYNSVWNKHVWLKYLTGLLMAAVIVFAFISEKPVRDYGDEFRIFYFHVPLAIVCFVAFFINLLYSFKYLQGRNEIHDIKAVSAAELGIILGILATISGSIFSRLTWGAFWNWDIRQTSIVILLAVYCAYFVLRSSVESEDRKAVFSSVYALLAFLAVPVFGILVPRLFPSLHPGDTLVSGGRIALKGTVALIFAGSLTAFTLLFFWLHNLRWRTHLLELFIREKDYE